MSKHTPGPWKECTGSGGDWCICGLVWSKAADIPVAKALRETDERIARPDEGDATSNARLIAAAPKLLEAAKKAEGVLADMKRGEGGDHVLSELHAAIAKARGPDA